MDKQIKNCLDLTEGDILLLYQIESGLAVTADMSKSDLLLCSLLSTKRAIVLRHVLPESTPSRYQEEISGRTLTAKERPLLLRALRNGSESRAQKRILASGVPVVRDVYPIRNNVQKIIGALAIETNMIEYERQRRREWRFRQAIHSLVQMCVQGEIRNGLALERHGPYDAIYLVDREHQVTYMSGIANNMFRGVGRLSDVRGQNVSSLEPADVELVEQVFQSQQCVELRHETEDGRVWVRKAIPLRTSSLLWPSPPSFIKWLIPPLPTPDISNPRLESDSALILIHNATESVQNERELNVKSAIIQEVHHRVKNNLQTIAAMLRIQARRSHNTETKQHLTDAVNRVLSMSVIHEFLSQDEHQPINVREVCQRVIAQVVQVTAGPDQKVDFRVRGPNIRLPASQATPTSMIVNELLLNAMEHGLKGLKKGRIEINLEDLGDAVQLTVIDDGHGLSDDFVPGQNESLGLQIVRTLVTDDLKGELTIESILSTKPDDDKVEPFGDQQALLVEKADIHQNGDEARCGTRVIISFPKRSLR